MSSFQCWLWKVQQDSARMPHVEEKWSMQHRAVHKISWSALLPVNCINVAIPCNLIWIPQIRISRNIPYLGPGNHHLPHAWKNEPLTSLNFPEKGQLIARNHEKPLVLWGWSVHFMGEIVKSSKIWVIWNLEISNAYSMYMLNLCL